MDKTELDLKNPAHQILVGAMSILIDHHGYSARELYQLIENSKKHLFFTFQEMAAEKKPPYMDLDD